MTTKIFKHLITTECVTTSRGSLRCKLEINAKIIEQVMKFDHLGKEISSNGNIENDVRKWVLKVNRVEDSINHAIFRNKQLEAQTKLEYTRQQLDSLCLMQQRQDLIQQKPDSFYKLSKWRHHEEWSGKSCMIEKEE